MRSAVPAQKEAAGVPSAWSQPFQSTHERPRRWCDAGPLGRQSVTAAQKAGDERTRIRCSISGSDSSRGSGSGRYSFLQRDTDEVSIVAVGRESPLKRCLGPRGVPHRMHLVPKIV